MDDKYRCFDKVVRNQNLDHGGSQDESRKVGRDIVCKLQPLAPMNHLHFPRLKSHCRCISLSNSFIGESFPKSFGTHFRFMLRCIPLRFVCKCEISFALTVLFLNGGWAYDYYICYTTHKIFIYLIGEVEKK